MSRFFWVRHGPTHAKGMVGWTDLPADLSDIGQLERLSAHLPDDALVVSSDLIRAADTATAIAAHRARLPHEPNLREINFGTWEMKRHFEIKEQDLARQYWERPGDTRPPQGESWNQVCTRVNGAVAQLLTAHPGRDIIAVAHFGVILTQVQRALGLAASEAFSHRIDNLSVTELRLKDGQWAADRINHLP
ncbi:histidine phosphatase family protein [Thalassobius vesicularis]|uniref:Histidine phosphatase family protein n=1 Tax=Thalassobius vesicularis TaxID=1294297 RepID=A0A4V3UZC6_9RHOB|nr:histidine phosphatase family protein [Thalassobius vesicularis]THD76365.1 histidine phosphatase family protein [Thalassobius vesicularis]